MSKKAPRIPNEIWDQHKEAIISFYSVNTLDRTRKYMNEEYGFQASNNQYTGKLKSWGVEKYHPGSDWVRIECRKRKRSQEGKASDVYIRRRKYTRGETEKEIARHVPLGLDWGSIEDALPDYITVCTPRAEPTGPPRMCRDFLLRDLPWYQCTEAINTFVSEEPRRHIATSTPTTSLGTAMRELASQSDRDLPQLCVRHRFRCRSSDDLNIYLPPKGLDVGNLSTNNSKIIRNKSPLSILKDFLKLFVFLSTNNVLGQSQFNKVVEWIVEKGGADILICFCRLGSPSIKVFAEKLFCSAVESGNLFLGRKVLQLGVRLQAGNPSRRERWTKYISEAVRGRHHAMVELLCKAGAHPEVGDRWSWQKDWDLQLPTLRTLLAFGADPEKFILGAEAGFPLVDAALNGSLEAVKLLLVRGARVNIYLPHYYGTALQAAACRGHLQVVKYLIRHGAKINDPSDQQIRPSWPSWPPWYDWDWVIPLLTPLQIAAKMNNVGLVQVLLQHGASAMACPAAANPERYQLYHTKRHWFGGLSMYKPQYSNEGMVYTALQYGALNQNMEIIALLLSTGVSPDSRVAPNVGDTPLQMSTRLGNVEMFQLLWSGGADLNAPPAACNGRTAMQGAAESGSWRILMMLLHAGAQIDAPAGAERGLTALQAACLNGHSLIAGALLANGADLNIGPSPVAGLTAIQAAVTHGDIWLVRDLIALGADVNDPATEGGTTALVAATTHKSLSLLTLLVQHGADVNATGTYGFLSPLREAASRVWLEGAKLLLEHGADVNANRANGFLSPLRQAADRDWLEGAKLFLEHGAIVNDTDFDHHLLSPLGLAISNASKDMIYLLLQHGADVLAAAVFDDCDDETQSSLIYALRQGVSFEVVDLLLAQVPDLEKHPGSENALAAALSYNLEVDHSTRQLMLEKVKSLPPLLRQNAIQYAWDALPTDYDGDDDDEEALLAVIELLIDSGVSLGSRAEDGSNIIQRASRYGFEKSYSSLISHGAAVNIHATELWGTPLQEAIKNGHSKIANALLEHGADVNALPAADCGVTALQAASINGMFGLAVQLLERGADVAAPAAPRDGRTAIDGAAERGRFDMVQLLLNAYGDDADLEPVRRQAAGYAEKQGHFELAHWLREYSAG